MLQFADEPLNRKVISCLFRLFYAERHYSTCGDNCWRTCYNRTGMIWQFLICCLVALDMDRYHLFCIKCLHCCDYLS